MSSCLIVRLIAMQSNLDEIRLKEKGGKGGHCPFRCDHQVLLLDPSLPCKLKRKKRTKCLSGGMALYGTVCTGTIHVRRKG